MAIVNSLDSTIVGGNLVQLDSKNKFRVTDKKGKTKVLTHDQFKKQVLANQEKLESGEDIKFKKPMSDTKKVILGLLGIGAAVTGVFYRKNIAKYFKEFNAKETMNNLKNSESGATIKGKINETVDVVKEALENPEATGKKAAEATREAVQKTAQKAGELAGKATGKGLTFLNRISNFFSGFGRKAK